jgi:rhodanese-related sulfurtransferase
MKKLLSLLLVFMLSISLVACGSTDASSATESAGIEESATAYFAEFPGNRIIGWDALFSKIDAGDEPFILSIRSADDYAAGHIEGAMNAAWGADLASKVSMLPTDQPVYVYCYSGQTAGQTIALLNMLGIEAYSVKSGFNKGAMQVEGYEAYVSTDAVELADAGAEFDADALAFVEDYFNTVKDNGNFMVASDAVSTLTESGDAVVVDIRTADDYAAGHIEGAISVPYGANMQELFADLPADTKLIVTCYSGQTAGQTVAVLRALGHDAVSLKYGMNLGYAPYKVTTAATSYFANFEGNNIVSWDSVLEKIDAGENPYILSIRQAADYEAGHIVGAVNAAWGADLASKVSMLPTDQPVYVYCYSGQTAGQTIALLRMAGVEAYSIKSGMNAFDKDANAAYLSTDAVEMVDAAASFDPFVLASVVSYFNAIPEGGSNIMASDAVLAAVEAGEVTVVDIRTTEDFEAGHIEGAVNLPYGKGMEAGFADLPSGKLVVACYSGQTAGQTVAIMRELGYNAVSLKSGMVNGWLAAELPVVTN